MRATFLLVTIAALAAGPCAAQDARSPASLYATCVGAVALRLAPSWRTVDEVVTAAQNECAPVEREVERSMHLGIITAEQAHEATLRFRRNARPGIAELVERARQGAAELRAAAPAGRAF